MLLISTAKVITDPLGQLLATEQAVGLHYPTFGMDPARFDGVEPRAFGGQGTGENAHPLASALDRAVVFPNPVFHFLTDVPGGIVPHQEHAFLPSASSLRQTHSRKAMVTPL